MKKKQYDILLSELVLFDNIIDTEVVSYGREGNIVLSHISLSVPVFRNAECKSQSIRRHLH